MASAEHTLNENEKDLSTPKEVEHVDPTVQEITIIVDDESDPKVTFKLVMHALV